MEPTLSIGDKVTVDLAAYDSAEPESGDLITFHPPSGVDSGAECGARHSPYQACPKPTSGLSTQLFLKRVVALPGDELSIRDGQPIINGSAVLTDVIRRCTSDICQMPKPIQVSPDHYFVMGDNNAASSDSRFWGPVPSKGITGKVED